MASKVAFHTLGCKLNFSETSTIGEQFLKEGFEIVDFKSVADVYVINTCTVTDNADKECRQIVRRALRNNSNAFVAVTGCYSQLRPEEIASIKGVDAVFGSNEKFKLFSILDDFNKKEQSCVYVQPTEEMDDFHSAYSTDADNRTRAFFKIQDGCDYKCTFCTIPLARGKSRSQDPDKVIEEFKKILKAGYKEIILTGVNVGDYGKKNGTSLFAILEKMVALSGDFRIRISSIEPNLLTDDIIQLASENEKLCNHFHIPLQSGSQNVLQLMKRRYTANYYKDLVSRITNKIEGVGLGIDVIVGTPGETEDDFLETYNFIKDLPVSYLHVFTYSERPNTKAIEMNGKVDVVDKKRRNNMLRILSEKKKNQFYRDMIGKEVTVLFEKNENNSQIKGFTSNYVSINHPVNFDLVNTFTNVKIVDVINNYCVAQLV